MSVYLKLKGFLTENYDYCMVILRNLASKWEDLFAKELLFEEKIMRNYYSRFFWGGGGVQLLTQRNTRKTRKKLKHFAGKIKHFTKLRWVNPSPACVPVVWSSLFARVRYKLVKITNKKYMFSGFYFMQTYLQK